MKLKEYEQRASELAVELAEAKGEDAMIYWNEIIVPATYAAVNFMYQYAGNLEEKEEELTEEKQLLINDSIDYLTSGYITCGSIMYELFTDMTEEEADAEMSMMMDYIYKYMEVMQEYINSANEIPTPVLLRKMQERHSIFDFRGKSRNEGEEVPDSIFNFNGFKRRKNK